MIVLPYLGPAAARRERRGRARAACGSRRAGARRGARGAQRDPLEGVPMRLTYRTARVLEGVAELTGRADPSNREVADYAGIQDPGQISKLLRRLERLGLLANTAAGHAKGEPNAWAADREGRAGRAEHPHAHPATSARPRDAARGRCQRHQCVLSFHKQAG